MAAQKKIRLALVGCGNTMNFMYGPVLPYLKNAEVVAAVDPDPARLRWVKARHGVPLLFRDVATMLQKAGVDGVIIGSPQFFHKEQVLRCAQAGKHVLCEKPMARNIGECDAMIKACRENKVILMSAFMKRFDKSFMLAKRMIDSGRLGKVFQIEVRWNWFYPGKRGWRGGRAAGGGIFADGGSHTVDVCRFWVGDVATVSGEIGIISENCENEDQAAALLRHKNGVISYHTMTRLSHERQYETYKIFGAKATLTLTCLPGRGSSSTTEPFNMTLYQGGKTQADLTRYNALILQEEIRRHNPYLKELEHFCDCIRTGRKPLVTGEDGRQAVEVINAVYLSSYRREKIRLPLAESPDLERLFEKIKEQSL